MPIVKVITNATYHDVHEEVNTRNTENYKRDNSKGIHFSVQKPEKSETAT
jgi:hypothetical protein